MFLFVIKNSTLAVMLKAWKYDLLGFPNSAVKPAVMFAAVACQQWLKSV
jgi:hypothetical protein